MKITNEQRFVRKQRKRLYWSGNEVWKQECCHLHFVAEWTKGSHKSAHQITFNSDRVHLPLHYVNKCGTKGRQKKSRTNMVIWDKAVANSLNVNSLKGSSLANSLYSTLKCTCSTFSILRVFMVINRTLLYSA